MLHVKIFFPVLRQQRIVIKVQVHPKLDIRHAPADATAPFAITFTFTLVPISCSILRNKFDGNLVPHYRTLKIK